MLALLLLAFLQQPAAVTDLAAAPLSDTALVVTWTEVRSGTTSAARYELRVQAEPPGTFNWGTATVVAVGSCTAPRGSTAAGGSARACVLSGLRPRTLYSLQAVAYTGVLNSTARFGPLSNIASAATAQRIPAGIVFVHEAVSGSQPDSVRDTVPSPPTPTPPAVGVWPHEPVGWTSLAEHAGDVLTPSGWGQVWNDRGYASVAADASAPLSPPSVLQYRWPAGWTNQVGMAALYHGLPGVRRVFVGIWWKPSNPWQGHVSNTNKIQYLFTNNAGSMFMAMYGPPGGPFEIVVFPQFSTSRDRWLVPNVNRVNVTLGQWHRIEWLVDYSAAVGRIQWWLDGVLLGDYSDDPSPPEALSEYKLHPVWGGAESIPKVQTDYFWYDHIRVSRP